MGIGWTHQAINTVTIRRLVICDWQANGRHDTVIESPSWPQIETAIRSLNNRNLNDLYLEPEEGGEQTFLCIGGGSGQYIASGSVNGQRFPTLSNCAADADSKIDLIVGGQLGDYPANYVVDLASVLAAARSFFESGTFASSVDWIDA